MCFLQLPAGTAVPARRSPTTPHTQPLPGITCAWFSLIRFRSPLLTESLLFSLPTGTEMFHFPAFPPHALYIQARVTAHHRCWVSPFGHPRITARLTAPRGLTQPPTSFIGSWCQGIHRVLLHTYNTKIKDARVHCPVLKQHTHHHTHHTRPPTPQQGKTSRAHPAGTPAHHIKTTHHTQTRGVFPQSPTACRLAPPPRTGHHP